LEATAATVLARTAPTTPSERIIPIDALRGFAVLGILIMNIQSYSMIEAAYLNPTAYGDLTGINKWVWTLSHIFANEKFMGVFSILFGAGILLFTGRVEARGKKSAGLHYRRTLFLILIGLAHAYLLWYGDILVAYGLCALLLFFFRKLAPKWLLPMGIVTVAVASIIFVLFGWSLPYWPQEAYQQTLQSWSPSAEAVAREISAYRGGWLEQMSHRIPAAIMLQTFLFLTLMGWRAGGMMLVGMGLFKWGVLSAERSKRFYATLMVLGFAVGLPTIWLGVVRNFDANWFFDYSMFLGMQFNYWGSIPMALGYIGIVMLIYKSISGGKLVGRFAAVGRMALTNYLLQTVICTTIFYGHGLGLFGQVERSGQILIVFTVWAFELILSPVWLRHFRFGPAEWLWRSLTYLRFQPMRHRA
jgi:uncharacterized protein